MFTTSKIKIDKDNGCLCIDSKDAMLLSEELKYLSEESVDHGMDYSGIYSMPTSNLKKILVVPYRYKSEKEYLQEELYQFNAQVGDVVLYKNKKYIVIGIEVVDGCSLSLYIIREGRRRFRMTKVFKDEKINDLKLIC